MSVRSCCLPVLLLLVLAFSGGCSKGQGERPIGEGYAGAMSPTLRDKLGAGSTVVGTLKPGEHVVIYQKRRRWVRIRTDNKQEGWTDERNILAPEEYEKFQGVVKSAVARPSQGRAKARDLVNLHLEADRKAPSFYQMAEGEACEIIEHRAAPKPLPTGSAPAPAAQTAPGGQPGQQPGQPQAAQNQPPAKPEPAAKKPEPPAKGRKGKEAKKERKKAGPEMEDWFLVRGKGKAGWALASKVDMDIPDDVLQYAEGKRIMGWQVLNEVQSGDQKKAQYIWATSDEAGLPYDFTGIRVFIWNAVHRRYETSYRERNLRGVFPLTVGKVQLKTGEAPSFTLNSLDQAGNRNTREFVLLGNIVRRREQAQ